MLFQNFSFSNANLVYIIELKIEAVANPANWMKL